MSYSSAAYGDDGDEAFDDGHSAVSYSSAAYGDEAYGDEAYGSAAYGDDGDDGNEAAAATIDDRTS